MAFIDTNILFDIITDDPQWSAWSIWQLDRERARGTLRVNDVVYAELSVRFPTIEAVDEFIEDAGIEVASAPRPALFLAAKAFQRYRAGGGVRTGVLPDFFIGAHAAVAGDALITRDARRYRTYFPALTLIVP